MNLLIDRDIAEETIGINILSDLRGNIRVEIINIQPFQRDSTVLCIILKFFFLYVYTSMSKIKKLSKKKKKGMNPYYTSFTKSPFYEDCRYLLSLFKNQNIITPYVSLNPSL